MSFEPQPINPFTWLIILLLGSLFYFFGYQTSSSVSVAPEVSRVMPATPDMVLRPSLPNNADMVDVATVDWVIRESSPPQVTLIVSGYWTDGCSIEPKIESYRDGDVIYVQIYRIVPPNIMCTQMMHRFSTDVPISHLLTENNVFRSGTYTINVNGIEKQADF